MLNQETLAAIAKAVNIDASELASKIASEQEEELSVDVVQTFTSDSWQKLQETIDSEKAAKYNEGRNVASRQLVRDWKEKTGVSFEGKNPEDFLPAYKDHILNEADKNPDERIKALQKDIKILQEDTLPAKNEEIKRLSGVIQDGRIKERVYKHIPDSLPKGMTKDDAYIIMRNQMSFSLDEENREVVMIDGEVLKNDSTRENKTFSDAITDFSVKRDWRRTEVGRGEEGGGEPLEPTSDYKKMRKSSDLYAYMEEKGINPSSIEGKEIVQEVQKSAKESKQEFIFDE